MGYHREGGEELLALPEPRWAANGVRKEFHDENRVGRTRESANHCRETTSGAGGNQLRSFLVVVATVDQLNAKMTMLVARETQINPDLARLIDAWPKLPDAVRAGIVAMVKATETKR
jgi:hypothetical protein